MPYVVIDERPSSKADLPKHTPGESTVYYDTKAKAFSAWHELLVNPEIWMDAQEQYDELLRLADNFREKGIIDSKERKTLIEVATVAYTRAVECVVGDL